MTSSSSFGVGARESSARAMEANGEIRFEIVLNDGKDISLERLATLKNIFAAQLPKMPREYIVRLVFDKRHVSLAILRDKSVLGGICYRPFYEEAFAEIAFCAITASEQVRGFGTRVMNHLKEQAKKDGIKYFLTYADNYAIGYFKKQGFSKSVKYLPRASWFGRIKDYDGGTLMECYIHPTIQFLNIQDTIAKQRAFILEQQEKRFVQQIFKLPSTKKSKKKKHKDLLSDESFTFLDAIPGLSELGYTDDELRKLARPNDPYGDKQREEINSAISLLDKLKKHDAAWPFLEPVDITQVSDYLDVISDPIDLATIEEHLADNKYRTFADVKSEINRMLENCRTYGGTGIYVKTADTLQRALDSESRKLEEALSRFHAIYDAQHDLLS